MKIFLYVLGFVVLLWLLYEGPGMIRARRARAAARKAREETAAGSQAAPRPAVSVTATPISGAVSKPSGPMATEIPPIRTGALRVKSYETVTDFVVIDTETTGFSSSGDRVIEIAAIRCRQGEKETFQRLINPGTPIPQRIQKLTGITDEDVAEAPGFGEIAPEILSFVGDLPVVAHNASFDVGFLSASLRRAGIGGLSFSYIDTVAMARQAFPGMKNYKLETLIKELSLLGSEQQHRAESDAEATLKLFLMCREELAEKERIEKQKEKDRLRAAAENGSPFDINAYAMACETDGELEAALQYYEKAVEKGFEGMHPYDRLAILYKKQKSWTDVVRVCDRALEVFRDSPNQKKDELLEKYKKRRDQALNKLEKDAGHGEA